MSIVAVVVGVGALATAMVWQGQYAFARQQAANRWYEHTQDVLAEIGSFTTALSETQRGAGGYLLSGDIDFVDRYRSGAQATLDHLQRIRTLTADNPHQQLRQAALASDTAVVLSIDEREVQLEAAGRHAEALALVRSKAANEAIQRVQALSSEFAVEERRLLTMQRETAARSTSSTARITLALAVLGAGLLVVAAALGAVALTARARARVAMVRAQANERLAASAARLAQFIAEAPVAIVMFDRQMRYLAASGRFLSDSGLPPGTVLEGRSHYDIFPEIPKRWRAIHSRVLAGATESHDRDSFPRADGRVDWVRWRMTPWRDDDGQIGGAILFSEFITPQVEEHRALLSAEARLSAIVETAVDAIVVIDEAGIIQSANPATEILFRYTAEELVGRNISMLMPEPHHSAHDGYLTAYQRTGRRRIIGVGREVEGLRKDGSRVPIDLGVAEWMVEGRRHFTGLMRDITLRKMAEAQRLQAERRELVVGELRHRLRNMFTVVCSLVMATARSHRSISEYRDAMLKRITAFANAQVELAGEAWSKLDLRDLIEFELTPYADGQIVSLEGEPISLNSAAAEGMALIVHELATNAAKYGALSRAGAALTLRWGLSGDGGDGPRLVFEWVESGGPPVAAPTRRGFGSSVIERSVQSLGGEAALDFAPEGLSCTITLSASRVILNVQGTPEPSQQDA